MGVQVGRGLWQPGVWGATAATSRSLVLERCLAHSGRSGNAVLSQTDSTTRSGLTHV